MNRREPVLAAEKSEGEPDQLFLIESPTKTLPAALKAIATVRGRASSSVTPQVSFSTAFNWLKSSMLLRSRM